MKTRLTWTNEAGVHIAVTPLGKFLVGAVVSAGKAFDATLSRTIRVSATRSQGTKPWNSKVCSSVAEAKAEAQRYYDRQCQLASIADSAC